MAVELTDKNFREKVLESEKIVLVDFWAQWCGPCLAIAPMIEELSKEFDGKAVIGKLDVDNNPKIAQDYGIRNIPTLLFFKDGEVVDKQVGAVPKTVLSGKLNNYIE
jgi:thioredoxin 1